MTRDVVVQLWAGVQVVRRLPFMPADVDAMSDAQVETWLRKLGVNTTNLTIAQQRTSLKAWPTQGDLDALATAMTAANDGVRPTARVLEETNLPNPASGRGAAGSVPRSARRWP